MDGLRNYPDEPHRRSYPDRPDQDGDRHEGYGLGERSFDEPQRWEPHRADPPTVRAEADYPPQSGTSDRYRTQSYEGDGLHRSGPAYGGADPARPAYGGLYPPAASSPTGAPSSGGPVGPGLGSPVSPVSGAWGEPAGPSGPAPGAGHAFGAGSAPRSGASGPSEPAGGAVYRPRRPGLAALLAAAAIFGEILLLRVLLVAEFGARGTPGGVLAGLFALAGVPLVALGVHGLATGAAAVGPNPGRLWLRVPLAYLPIGLTLLLAAALAVR